MWNDLFSSYLYLPYPEPYYLFLGRQRLEIPTNRDWLFKQFHVPLYTNYWISTKRIFSIKALCMDYKSVKFMPSDKMGDLINHDYKLLLVMSRFGLPLGFGDKTVEQVCREKEVNCPTFLAVANFIHEGNNLLEGNLSQISVRDLMDYLKQAHSYFLDFFLPSIRERLVQAISKSIHSEITYLILKFFDEYVAEVRRHMEYEEMNVFTYVDALQDGTPDSRYTISVFARRHNQIGMKLVELKNIILKYYPEQGNNNLLNAVLIDIFSCEEDLASHCKIEDFLLVPVVRQLEKKKGIL